MERRSYLWGLIVREKGPGITVTTTEKIVEDDVFLTDCCNEKVHVRHGTRWERFRRKTVTKYCPGCGGKVRFPLC